MAPERPGHSPLDPRARARPDGAPAATASPSSTPSSSGGQPPYGVAAFAAGELIADRFRIVRFIASGGMGEVYEAHDEELHDRVALKTIRPEIARDEQALRRFRREVLLARKVTHPNICRTFDVFRHRRASGDQTIAVDDVVFVTMELLSGETLAERLRRAGRLSTSAALPIVTQIAAALTAAHAVGVVHRDLKSSNVMLLPSSGDTLAPPRAVVSDFGLAHGIAGADTTISETVTRVLGTPAYMAPEQIEGGPITPSVDIYALGVVMFEMVTGARPFVADTPFSTALKRLYEPPPSAKTLAPDIDPNWDATILRCLERAPANRFSNAGDVIAALTDGTSVRSIGTPVPAPSADLRTMTWRRPGVIGAVAASIAALGAVAVWMLMNSGRTSTLTGGQLVLLVSSQERAYQPAISPDGRTIAYIGEDAAGHTDLFVADTRGEGRVRLTSDDAREENPQVSPDGSRVVFTRVGREADRAEIWTVPLLGGQLRPLVRGAAAPAWSPDGTRLVFVHRLESNGALVLATANADGSDLKTLLPPDPAYLNVRAPAWSPDGEEVAFIRGRGGVTGELWIVPVAGGAPRRLSNDPTAVFSDDPVFTADGTGIVHASNRGGATNIWVMPREGGTPIRVTTGPGPDEAPSIARDGTLVFGSSRWRNVLLTHNLSTGSSETLLTHSRFLWAPSFSPDGREVAYSQGEVDGSWHIWIAPVSGGGAPRRLTSTAQGEIYPRFTPDGAFVVFHNWNTPSRIWQVPRTGGPPSLLPIAQSPGDTYADISPDGRSVAFVRADEEGEHVYLAPVTGGPARRLVPGLGTVPRWSPNGEFIALSQDRTYGTGVSVVRADGTGLRKLTERGGWPVWWPDGRQIAYLTVGLDGNQIVEVVPFEGGTPRRLESLRYSGDNYPVAISPDGRLFATTNGSHVSDEIWMLQPAGN
jgi:Tol biopolymer transport system component